MKNIIYLLSIILIVSCSGDKKDEQKNDKNKEVKKAEIVKGNLKSLEYNFNKGQTFKYRLNTVLNNFQSVQTDTLIKANMSQNSTYVFNFKVLDVDKQNIATISLTPVSIYVKSNINGQTALYDSRVLYSLREKAMFADYEALKNRSYKVKVSSFGEVLDIFDADRIINEIWNLQGIKDSLSKDQKNMFKRNFVLSGLAPITEQLFRTVTKEKVGINSTWEQKYPSNLGSLNITNTASFKILHFYKEKDDSIAKIQASLSTAWTGNNTATEQGVTYTFSNPNISGSGEIYYNLAKKLVQRSQTKINSETEVTMKGLDASKKEVKATKKEKIDTVNKLELL
ncbi:MAG: hypothetical protein CO129_04335 [Ignavibacteriales bacterium CG_4_9_14_3_um_filter_34_10]|nr:MAG: hypothetical protein CO129_04335 [Ignavibacteriales bacterium CG_4_9_14_3_um_filter_34_10]